MAARVEKARVPSSLYVCFKLFLGFGFDKNLYICLQFAMVCLFSMFVLVLVGTGVLVRTTPWRSNGARASQICGSAHGKNKARTRYTCLTGLHTPCPFICFLCLF